MQQRFAEPFRIGAVAEAVGVSRRSLEMRFRAERNTSPADFLVNFRLQKVKAMLKSHLRKPTEEIARTCGFGTGKNLRAALHRILNATTNDFRPE